MAVSYETVRRSVIDQIEHRHDVFRAYFKSGFLKQYEKFLTFLRNELVSNNLTDFGLRKGLDHLDAVRTTFQVITDRFVYILGARERSDAVVRKIVLDNDDPFVPLLVERKTGETQLFVKQVKVEGKRYVVCRNEQEAENDRKDREAIVAALDAQLKRGDKALIGNSAYRRYLRAKSAPRTSGHSRSTPANSPKRRASTGSSCCALTPKSRRCRRFCTIAIFCKSRTSSAEPSERRNGVKVLLPERMGRRNPLSDRSFRWPR